MRTTLLLCGLGGCALLATAVLAVEPDAPAAASKKKDDGPGMTFNQKVTSLFGLIDRGSPEAPPPPPGMPPMGARGSVRIPSPAEPEYVGAPAQKFQPTANRPGGVYRDPSLPQPPQPKRIADGPAVVSDVPRTLPASTPGTAKATQPRQSLVGTSKMPLFATQPKTVAPIEAKPTTGVTHGWTASGSTAAAKQPNVAPKPVYSTSSQPAGGGVSATSATTKPFVSSRRRVTTESASSTEPSVATTESPSLIAAPPTPIPSTPSTSNPITSTPPAPIASVEVEAEPKLIVESDSAMPAVPSLIPEPIASEPAKIATTAQPTTLPSATAATPQPPRPQTVINPTMVASPAAAQGRGDVLVSYTNPELTVDTLGPRKVSIGREADYRVVVRNRGNTEARDVVISLQAPEHAEIAGLHSTSGHSTTADELAAGTPLEWRLDLISPNAQEELTLTLVPRRSESFELGVHWTSSTPVSRAMVEVEEPKLALAITGPNEVVFGEQRLFKLTVSNPGTGTAENVQLNLMPLSPTDGEPVRHAVGTLKPGESSIVEVELTARQAGALRIRTEALAEGNLRAEAAADVLVRRAVLDVAATAPRTLFAGVPGTYEVRVKNSGDDAARNVRISVDLPTGMKLIGAMPTTAGGKSNQLVWTFDRIAPGSEQVCTLKCAWDQGGKQQLNVTAVAAGEISKTASAATDVQAVADLALDVVDTVGPIPVGRPVTYEIHVKNRGLKAAEGVDVVAYFSEGIEPERAEGQGYELQPGMVVFKSLAIIGPGQEKVLKVTARAQTAGNHRIRVEMQGTSPQTQLSHEDGTFFYVDEAEPAATPVVPPATFKPQTSSPIRPTAGSAVPGAPQPVNNAAPSYRVNTIR